MGGVIGAISGKFVIAATGLLVSASIEGHRLQARIDPRSEASIVSERIADQVDKGSAPHDAGSLLRRGRPMTIAMSGGTFPVDALAVAPSRVEAGSDFRIGRDILEGHVFDLDFRSRQIRMVLPYEYARATRRLIAVDLTAGPDGSWSFPAGVNGKPVSATLRLSDPRGATIGLPSLANGGAPLAIAVGAAALSVSDVVHEASADARAPLALGLGAFDGRRVILDLPHRLLWIDPRGTGKQRAVPAARE
ncbi:hypothetical protein JMG10_16955 [Nostoc ellipsosporum NOK]|uniref:hypothetical protein n=1 Tax=Sphingomonas sp. IBVSS2 TaxID=1985172 RepID=UPI000A2E73AE|nr:hypothetical protein [Sphingomonas sp. IBVSS2]MDF2383175.1 hypothetical protein [Nostoc ellipsosporum NOK]OSZ69518.1 hypothetical protein CAP40_01265 [Sphingomonas sp. IBVSS2]